MLVIVLCISFLLQCFRKKIKKKQLCNQTKANDRYAEIIRSQSIFIHKGVLYSYIEIQMHNPNQYGNNDLRKKIEDYSYGLKDVIGRGYSSVVYRGSNDKSKEKVAIKVIDIRAIQGKPEKRMLEGQIDALKKLNHPNVLKCHDIFSTANNCYIITEFCNQGDLQHLLKKRQKLSETEALPLIRQILMGFIHISENGFLHRDLKPANILIRDKTVKIADFGFAKRAGPNSKESVNVGSPLYMSPEALQSNIYTAKNDIWSIGVIFYEMLHGRAPWSCTSERQLIEQINRNSVSLLKGLSDDLKDFIRKCLTPDERKRPGLKDIINHPLTNRLITETGPLLLRKVTSMNENQDLPPLQAQNQQGMNKPKILHHRNHKEFTPQKQFLSHLNWMRYLNKFSDMFPDVRDSTRYTLGLRFIITKQLLSQLQALEQSINGENAFMIEGWKEFLAGDEKKKYVKSLQDYRKRFEPLYAQLKEWLPIVGKDKDLTNIVDLNFYRSEFLSMQGLKYAIEECKSLWKSLEGQKSKPSENELEGKAQINALRLDFTMTYYQLNSILLDSFYDSQYISRMSCLETINDFKPVSLQVANLRDLEIKLKSLQIIK